MTKILTKVAIVEDDKVTCEVFETIVDAVPGYRCVCTCRTAEEALFKLPQQELHVILMDVQLPKISGIDCIPKLKELLPRVEVIMVTACEDAQDIFRAFRAGASGYLLKRSTREQIVMAIRDVREGGVPMSNEIARKIISHFKEKEIVAVQMKKLTSRESQVLDLIIDGLSNKEIAHRLGVTWQSLRWHQKNIYLKLHVHSRNEIMVKFRSRT